MMTPEQKSTKQLLDNLIVSWSDEEAAEATKRILDVAHMILSDVEAEDNHTRDSINRSLIIIRSLRLDEKIKEQTRLQRI